MGHVQLQFSWPRTPPIDAEVSKEINSPSIAGAPALPDVGTSTTEAALPSPGEPEPPPFFRPLPEAAEAGVFGISPDGPVILDDDQIAAMTAEHANEMILLLADITAVSQAVRLGHDPRTGRMPKTLETRARLGEFLAKEQARLGAAYADAVAAYAAAFGDEAAAALDAWVHKVAADDAPSQNGYEPTHPWHYHHAGDNAPPVPVEDIPTDADAGCTLENNLPKNTKKRIEILRELIAREREQLRADQQRYVEIVESGAEALSRYDREISHASDTMARASALALKYRHISLGRGRLQWIEAELKRLDVSL